MTSNATEYLEEFSGLTPNTQYQFRVKVIYKGLNAYFEWPTNMTYRFSTLGQLAI